MTNKKQAPNKPETLIDCLKDIKEPRIDRTRDHKLIDILGHRPVYDDRGGREFHRH